MINMKTESQEPLETSSRVCSPWFSRHQCECHFELCQTYHKTWVSEERLENIWEKVEEAASQIMIEYCVPILSGLTGFL